MQIHISARHIKLTKPLRDYVDQKVGRAQRYFEHLIWAQVILEVEKNTHRCEVVVHASRHTFRASANGADLYASIDLATDRIDAQLKKHKERTRSHHKGQGEALRLDEISMLAPETPISVIKEFPLRPMTRNQAAEEMDRAGYSFWVYQDSDTQQVNVIYRRMDDSYGILQPIKRK